MSKLDTLDWMKACTAVMDAALGAKPGALLQYAATYANHGLAMQGEARRVQALYVLCNLGGWHGPEATKAVLKAFSKE